VKDVEAAVGENDFLTLPLQDTQDFFQLIWGFDLFIGHDPTWEKGQRGINDLIRRLPDCLLTLPDGLVKSPSAALRFNFVVAAHVASALLSSVFARPAL